MVFQEYALFPWMTVEQNVGFGLEIKGMPRAQIIQRVGGLLKLLSLEDFAKRYLKDLSGGMRQGVAIARVLALDSPILLMDEPFGALDALTRRNLQDELLRLWAELKKTVIFVTHSIEEAIYLADRIVVMTYRPGTIKRDMLVELPRLRDPAAPEFNALKRELGLMVMEEQQRHHAAEIRAAVVDWQKAKLFPRHEDGVDSRVCNSPYLLPRPSCTRYAPCCRRGRVRPFPP